MFRTTDMVLIAVMVSAAAFTYHTKYQAENQVEELRKVEAKIRFERDTIDVLKADWSLLTQPSRLQRLTEVYADELKLVPVEPRQIVTLDEVPVRPLRIEDLTADGADGTDPVTTGGTER